jgi:hypothetical protein
MIAGFRSRGRRALVIIATPAVIISASCAAEPEPRQRTFRSPEEASLALADAVKAADIEELGRIFGPGSEELVDSKDPVASRRNREIFTVAFAERWEVVQNGTARTLIVGHENWPFPVPLQQDGNRWRFDTEAGRSEVLARRIGRNELAVIQICRTYVTAQRRYAQKGHDGKPAGLYAQRFRSEPGRQDGLYWPAATGEPRSPLGDLVAQAAEEGRPLHVQSDQPAPFHGYYFKILTGQGASATGGAKSYIKAGDMSGGFALIAWPAEYDRSGVMTFMVNHEGVVFEKDLGPESAAASTRVLFDPDASWRPVE